MRTRLAITFALIGLALSAGIGFGVYALSAGDLRGDVRASELRRAELAAVLYDGSRQIVVGAARNDRSAPPALQHAVGRGLVGTYLDGTTIWAAAPARGGGIYVEDTATDTAHTLANLRNILLGVGAAATLLAALAGALIADRLSRPLRRTADAADRMGAGDLDARTGVRGRDEVGRLGAAVDAMADAVQGMILRERRFSADVAHELRTPVTALVTAGALLDDSRAAEVVRERVATLRSLIEDLLEISRLEQGAGGDLAPEPVELGTFLAGLLRARDLTAVEVEFDEPGQVRTDPRRLERVLANLIDNAVRHGAAPVRVHVAGTTLTVTDSGLGFPADLLDSGPAPFRTAAAERGTGTGLGLVIATAQARAIGASLELSNPPSGGAAARLRLPLALPATLVGSQVD